MKSPTHAINVRFPIPMREWLVRESEKNFRSVNSEILLAVAEKMRAVDANEKTATE